MKINFHKKYLIISSIFLLFSFSAFLFLYQKIGKIKNSTSETELSLKEEIKNQDKVRSMSVLMQSIEKEKTSFESHFIKKSDIVYFLESIEQSAKSVGASATIVDVKENQDKAELDLGLYAEGSFESIYKFFMLLENAPYEIEIVDFDMQKTNKMNGPLGLVGSWDANIKIKLLSFSKS